MPKTLTAELPNGKTLSMEIPEDADLNTVNTALQQAGVDPSGFQEAIQGALGSVSDDDLVQGPDPKKLAPAVQSELEGAEQFPVGSTERGRALESAKKIEDLLGAGELKKLATSITAEDIANIVDKQKRLKDMIDFKSRGFGGKGIDTGQVMGGGIPLPFTDAEIPFVPSGVNETYNQLMGEGENAADRTELRRKQLGILNPERKEVTGASAALQELMQFIFPTLPNESDNDLGFYQKGMGTLKESQSKLQGLLDVIERSGSADVTGFKDIRSKTPDQVIEELLKQVTQGLSLDDEGNVHGAGEYGFGSLLPDTTKTYLQSMSGDKSARLEELRKKKAAGTLR